MSEVCLSSTATPKKSLTAVKIPCQLDSVALTTGQTSKSKSKWGGKRDDWLIERILGGKKYEKDKVVDVSVVLISECELQIEI